MRAIRIPIALCTSILMVLGFASCNKELPKEYTELDLSHCLTPTAPGVTIENNNEAVLDWIASKDADSYNVQIATDAEFTEIIKNLVVPANEVPYRLVLEPGTYYYRIQATSKAREPSFWSASSRKFTIKEPMVTIDLSAGGTANCYVVSKAGSYKFKPTRGCTDTAVQGIQVAQILWETSTESTGATLAANSVIDNVTIDPEGYVLFSTPETLKPGNALIAVKNEGGTILWSWHIWVVGEAVADVDWGGGMVLMDRNLGELSAAGAPRSSMLYQFGRKDPFPGTNGEDANVAVAGMTTTHTNSQQKDLAVIAANPTTLYGAKTDNGANPNYNNDTSYLWGDYTTNSKTESDPCPPGYKVPQAWTAVTTGDDANNIAKTRFAALSALSFQSSDGSGHYKNTFDATLANGSTVRFGRSGAILICTNSASGTTAGGDVKNLGNVSFLWTASCTAGTYRRIATCIRIGEDGVTFWGKSGDSAATYHARSNAFPVRCEKIQ
ncbi:MAG: hypothetical protein IJM35_10415 [Bacteroidales bacterium]|nr:hypothetical protein [Bacteroidales bacterium]